MVQTKVREGLAMNQALAGTINRQIANWTVLYEKLHNYHWFVKGTPFFTLHEKFEQLYNEAADTIDELAERLLAIGGTPIGTLKQCLEQATIGEARGGETAEQMVQAIANDFRTIRNEVKQGIEQANEAGDDVTADMFTSLAGSLDKHLWMFQAFLG